MHKSHGVLFVAAVLGLVQPLAAERLPLTIANSETNRLVVTGAAVERLDTLDGSAVYKLQVQLAEPPASLGGLNAEYEVLAEGGRPLGGGMFTIAPKMLAPGHDSFTALTSFGGLELGSAQLLVIKITEPSFLAAAGPRARIGAARAAEAPAIVDTCTSYCDKCASHAETLCGQQGTKTYSCSCSGETRSCTFTCKGEKPQV
jgi:hypothetical protein